MARPINRQLTKQMLQQMGIYNIYWDTDNNEWWIDRYWYRYGKSREKKHIKLAISLAVTKHKYSKIDKSYPIVAFGYNNKTYTYPLARVIYCWFKGDIPEGMVIDHIDNNPYNNSIDNLQLLTQEDNLRKRFVDNPNANRNQAAFLK